jgi:AAA domain
MSDDLPPVSAIQRQQVSWLWPGRIPRGKVTVLDGDPGTGKSTLTLTITAMVTTGSPFPDGTRPERGGVLLLSAEDDVSDTIRPRLEAAGADLDHCWVLDEIHPGDEPPRPPEFPTDLERLEKLIVIHGAALVVIDPLMAYLSGMVDSHRDQDVRRVMAGFKRVAERTGAAILIVRHMNKDEGGGSALYRGSGSIGIVGAARAGLLVAPDPQDEQRRVLAMTKSNLAKMPDALAYRLVNDDLYDCAKVLWDGATNHTAADLLRPPDPDEAPQQAEAAQILREILGQYPLPARKVEQLAGQAGISKTTLHRARKSLGVITRREGYGPGSYYVWSMPSTSLPAGNPETHGMHAMDSGQTGLEGMEPHDDDETDDLTTLGGSPDD